MASTKHKGLPEKKKVEEAAFIANLGKMAMSKGKGMVKQKAQQVVKQKAANVAKGAIPQPNRDQQESVSLDPSKGNAIGAGVDKTVDQASKKMNQIKKQVLLKKLQAVRSGAGETVTASYKPEGQMTEGAGRAAIGAGLGAIVGGPVGAAIGGSIGAAMGKKKKNVTTGGKKVKKTATNFFKAEPKVTRSEGVINMVKKGLERDKKAKVEKKIKNRKAVPYAALAAQHQPEGELIDEAAPLAAVPAAAAKGVAVAGKVAVKGAAMVGKAVAKGAQVAGKAASSAAKAAKPIVKSGLKAAAKGTKAVAKSAGEGIKAGAKTAGQTVAAAAGDAGASVIKSAGEGAAQRVKQRIAGSSIAASYEPELSIVDKMVIEYSPLTELNKRERVEAGQGKRAAKKGDWRKQKAKTGRRNINRFETGTVKRTESSGGRKPSYKEVTLPNPKSGYGKKDDHYNKNKLTTQRLGAHGTASATEPGPQKHHSSGIVHHDSAQQQRRHEHQKRRGVKTKGTVAADIKKSLKDELSIVDKMLAKYLPESEVVSELKTGTLLSYSQKATNQLAFKGDGSKKARKRATGIKAATGKLAIRATDPDGSMGFNKNPKNEEIEVLRNLVTERAAKSGGDAALASGNLVGKTIGTVTGGLVGGLAGGFPGAAVGAISGNVVGGKLAPGNPEKKTIVKVKKEEVSVEEEVGISSSAAMEKARKEAQLQAKEDAKVAEKKKKKPVVEGSAYGLWKGDGKRKLPGDKKKKDVKEAKVDAGKSPEEKEKDRNVRKFGVSHNVAGHGKLRRALHRSNRGDKKIPGDKSQYVETEAYRVLAKDKTDLGRPAVFSYKDEKDAKKFADSIKSKGGKATVQKEGVMDIVRKYRKKQKDEKKPSMDSTTKKLHKWRKDKEHSEREKYVSPFRPIDYD
jgi:hypothetical protein